MILPRILSILVELKYTQTRDTLTAGTFCFNSEDYKTKWALFQLVLYPEQKSEGHDIAVQRQIHLLLQNKNTHKLQAHLYFLF